MDFYLKKKNSFFFIIILWSKLLYLILTVKYYYQKELKFTHRRKKIFLNIKENLNQMMDHTRLLCREIMKKKIKCCNPK